MHTRAMRNAVGEELEGNGVTCGRGAEGRGGYNERSWLLGKFVSQLVLGRRMSQLREEEKPARLERTFRW